MADIGSQIATYRYQRGFFFSLVLPGLLGVLAPLGYGFWLLNYAYTKHGPVAAVFRSRFWFQLAILALLVFLVLAVYRLIQARQTISIHKMGVLVQLRPFYSQKILWTEINGISNSVQEYHFLGIRLRTRQNATLIPSSGKPFILGENLEKLPELVSRLKASLYPRLLPSLKADFGAGKWLYFGPIAISQQGMRFYKNHQRALANRSYRSDFKNRNIFIWARIKRLTVHSGDLVVELRDQSPKRIPVSRIPNLELLLQIIQQEVKA